MTGQSYSYGAPGGLERLLEDIGEARASVVETPRQRQMRHRLAQKCLELSGHLLVFASELDPNLTASPAPGVAKVEAVKGSVR